MIRWMAAAAALGLTGCYTPGELVQSGTRWDYTSPLAPMAATECIARNANEMGPGIQAFTRTLAGEPGSEMVMRNFESAMVVVQARPAPPGSELAAFITYNMFPREGSMNRIMGTCATRVAK